MRVLHVTTGLQKAAGTSVFCGELANELVQVGKLYAAVGGKTPRVVRI